MTSATFFFVNEDTAPVGTTVYLHLDCDPYGASQYLRAMLARDGRCTAEEFIRANGEAQLLASPATYSNTSYRYTLGEDTILVEERLEIFEEGWKTLFEGSLVQFFFDQPGMMIHHVALTPGGRLGYYDLDQLQHLVQRAQRAVTAAEWADDARRANMARERLAECQAIYLVAFRVEEPDYA